MHSFQKAIYILAGGLALGTLLLAGAIKMMAAPARARLDASRIGIPLESHFIASPSGARLAAWYTPGKSAMGNIIVMHGVRANRHEIAARLAFLNTAGYGVLAFDFQAHGESSGDFITFGRLESLDARAAVAWLRARNPNGKVGAIGISLGGAAALLGREKLAVDALVLEAVYPDIGRAIAARVSARIGSASIVAAPIFMTVGRLVTGIDPEELRPIDGLSRIAAPVFIMAGVQDKYTPVNETREMFARANEPKILWEIEGAGHVDLHMYTRAEYERRVLAFFEHSLRQ